MGLEDGAFYCEAVYQGYQGTECAYRRSAGFAPEGGYILLPLEDVKKIAIDSPEIAWRAVGGTEHDGAIDIRSWARFQPRATTTGDRPPAPEPKGDGLKLFGDLALRTRKYPSGKLVDEIRYSDVYVDLGLEDGIPDQLANILEHEEGDLRVMLTDIRRYYPGYGPFFGRINCRHKTGAWDKDSIQAHGKPWEFYQVVKFLFSLLPGSPTIHPDSEISRTIEDAPQGLEGQGEPAVEVLESLLDRFGFRAQMLPTGVYMLSKSYSKRLGRLEIATEAGGKVGRKSVEEFVSYERMSSTSTERPAAVSVIGGRRIIRTTVHCAPVLQDPVDGLYYRLEAWAKKIGYPMEELNEQVFVRQESRFRNVPPDPSHGAEAAALHEARRDALMAFAYRQYLPACLFKGDGGLDLDEVENPILPMVDAPWYKSELAGRSKLELPRDKAQRGDLGEFVLMPPVVRGNAPEIGWFSEFEKVRENFQGRLAALRDQIQFHDQLLDSYVAKARGAGESLLRAEAVAEKTLREEELKKYGVALAEVEIGSDVQLAARYVGQVMPQDLRRRSTLESETAVQLLKVYADLAQDQEAKIGKLRAQVGLFEEHFRQFEQVYAQKRSLHVGYNGPHEIRKASVDLRTGLVTSGEGPLCLIQRPYYFDGDDQVVSTDGWVTVTFAHEVKGSTIASFTNYLFIADDDGHPDMVADVKFAGCHRSSPIKARGLRMESREYLMDNGNPVNYNACWSEAKGKAAALLAKPRRVPGWTLDLIGLRNAVLDAGTVSVQHRWDGDVGMTYVAVNNPNAQLPLGPAQPKRRRDTPGSDYRENQQRDRE